MEVFRASIHDGQMWLNEKNLTSQKGFSQIQKPEGTKHLQAFLWLREEGSYVRFHDGTAIGKVLFTFPQKEIQGKMLKLPQKPAFLGHLSEQINDQLRQSYYDPNVQINSQLSTCTI